MLISNLDHLVITVHDIEKTCSFYKTVMGFEIISSADGRKAIKFGNQKINLHKAGEELTPCAKYPTPGSADLCFITPTAISDHLHHLKDCGIDIEAGPVKRFGVFGEMDSVYFRDPDGNLLEVSHYL